MLLAFKEANIQLKLKMYPKFTNMNDYQENFLGPVQLQMSSTTLKKFAKFNLLNGYCPVALLEQCYIFSFVLPIFWDMRD